MSKEIQLLPHKGSQALPNDEIVARLRVTFAFVFTDDARARADIEEGIKRHEGVNPIVYEMAGAPQGSGVEIHRRILERHRASIAAAVFVSFGASADRCLSITLHVPENGLLFVAEEAWELDDIEKLARAIDYDMHEI